MREFLYDRLIKKYEKGVTGFGHVKIERGTSKDIFAQIADPTQSTMRDEIFDGPSPLFETLKREAKVILIDQMTLDSLVNVPFSNQSFNGEVRLPFPHTFFEFEKPIKYTTLEGDKNYDLGAFLFSDSGILAKTGEPSQKKSASKIFEIYLVDEMGYFGSANLVFSKNGGYMRFEEVCSDSKTHAYLYDSEKRALLHADKASSPPSVGISILNEIPEDEINMLKFANLSVNMLNLINAQNVTIREAYREKTVHIPSRRHKPRTFLIPTKPYYLVEIKKHYVEEEDKKEGSSWELGYRVWVRGHFRHYQDGRRIWIEPYVKGPPDSPWKHNRYQVLYDRFKHLLKNPKYLKE